MPTGEKQYCLRTKDGCTAAQHAKSEPRHIFGGGEEASVSSDATEDISILVIHFALNDAVAEIMIVERRWNLGLPLHRRIEAGSRHAERLKDLALTKNVE